MTDVDLEIDAFIERRALRTDAEQQRVENLFEETTRRHNERKRQANRLAWLDYHQGQAERLRRTLEALVSKHEEAAERLLETLAPSELEEGESWVGSKR